MKLVLASWQHQVQSLVSFACQQFTHIILILEKRRASNRLKRMHITQGDILDEDDLCTKRWDYTGLESDPVTHTSEKEPMAELDLQNVEPGSSSPQIPQSKRRTHETALSSSICRALHNRAHRNAAVHGVVAPTLKLESHIQHFSSVLEDALD